MPRSGPRRIYRFTKEFKGAAALDLHPFMLSKWRKDVRDGHRTADGWEFD